MLQGLLRRIARLRPHSSISVVGHEADWYQIDEGAFRLVPPLYLPSGPTGNRRYSLRSVQEAIGRLALGVITPFHPERAPLGDQFLDADLVIAMGGGYINDNFWLHGQFVLSLLYAACRRRKAVAMVGQGFGPLTTPALRAELRQLLPLLAYVAIRESATSPILLESLGYSDYHLTGDDAIDLVGNRVGGSATGPIGINVRVTNYSGVKEDKLDILRESLRQLSVELAAPLLPLPVVIDFGGDRDAIQSLVAGLDVESEVIATPSDLIDAIARCRLVITGSYHAAIFSTALGIPTLCLSASDYYDSKFMGIKDQFPGIVTIAAPGDSRLSFTARMMIDRSAQQGTNSYVDNIQGLTRLTQHSDLTFEAFLQTKGL